MFDSIISGKKKKMHEEFRLNCGDGLRLSTAFMGPENFHSTLKGPLSSARIERIAALAHSNLAQKTPVLQSSQLPS